MQLVFCTNNQHKIEEVNQIMGNGFEFLTLDDIGFKDEITEPFFTLEENSFTKSKQVFDQCGLACFSEDTGLFVESLGGEPGVLSARYAGDSATAVDNISKMLALMQGKLNRRAYFKTVITLLLDGKIYQCDGICEGIIANVIMGDDGFGYDPIFIPKNNHKSFAQLSPSEKNRVSHRGKAFESFKNILQKVIC
jgi:XTP/dITP diphosphohydrolase